jgi:hypothetical protein
VPFFVLAQIMGWSASATEAMAKRHGHTGDASLRQAMAVLDRPAKVGAQLQEQKPSGTGTERFPDKTPLVTADVL